MTFEEMKKSFEEELTKELRNPFVSVEIKMKSEKTYLNLYKNGLPIITRIYDNPIEALMRKIGYDI
jgi:hypothetical protein